MNTKYRILWIDDSYTFYESTEELINIPVSDNNMIPEIQFYDDYTEFQRNELDSFEAEIFNRYDLLLIDYALSGATGTDIIRELRRKQIFTDIVFYSSEPSKMRAEIIERCDLLDGVFFADRKDLTSVVSNVIKKNMRREYNIANIRGLIMDSTSEFDYICRITAESLFSTLNPADQAEVETQLRTFVEKATDHSTETFAKLDKKTGHTYVKAAMNSVDYVMSNADRYSILNLILQKSGILSDVPTDLDARYSEDIISARNRLAHSMLFYGECQKKLHITKIRQELKCDKECDNCKASYDFQACEVLRRKIFEYYQLFKKIDVQTSAHLKNT